MPLRLTNRQKAAALILSLDREVAVKVLSNLSEDELAILSRATSELESIVPDEETMEELLNEAQGILEGGGKLPRTAYGAHLVNLILDAFGPEEGAKLLSRTTQEGAGTRPFESLEALGPREVAEVLKDEHPQFIALYLCETSAERAGEVVGALPRSLQSEVVMRMATMGATTGRVLANASRAMTRKVREMGSMYFSSTDPARRLKTVAEVLNRVDESTEKKVLDDITRQDRKLAKKIKDQMFNFEDLPKLDQVAMQKILRSFDSKTIALSMKGTDPDFQEFILRHVSKRAREIISEEKEMLGAVPVGEVLEAQGQILKVVRDLIDSGEIKLGRGGGEARLVE